MIEPEMIGPDEPEAVRVAALLHPQSFALAPRPDAFANTLGSSAFDFELPVAQRL